MKVIWNELEVLFFTWDCILKNPHAQHGLIKVPATVRTGPCDNFYFCPFYFFYLLPMLKIVEKNITRVANAVSHY